MDWYKITAKADRKAVIQVYGFIGDSWDSESTTAKKFFKEVKALDVDEIELHVNSPGGSVFDGFAIYNLLTGHKAKVNVVIDAFAGSIASVIAMAGDSVEMPENALIMIHDPSGGVWGPAADMRKMAEVLDKLKIGMVAAYRDKTKMDEDKLAKLMTDETWLTAKEAVLMGFADKTTARLDIEACLDDRALAHFKNAPAQFVAVAPNPKKKEEKKDMITVEILKKDHPEIVAALLAEGITAAYLKDKHPALVAALTAEASAAGATAERERIQAVLAHSMPGHETLVSALAFDGATTAEQAAVQILAAEKKIRSNAAANLGKDGIKPLAHIESPDPAAGDTDAEDENIPIDERAKATWNRDAKLRAEFNNSFEAYLGFRKADAGGRVKILHRK